MLGVVGNFFLYKLQYISENVAELLQHKLSFLPVSSSVSVREIAGSVGPPGSSTIGIRAEEATRIDRGVVPPLES